MYYPVKTLIDEPERQTNSKVRTDYKIDENYSTIHFSF